MMRRYGRGGTFILLSTILFILSLFLPWSSVLSFTVNGFVQEGYLVLILFLYPLYTVFFNKNLKLFLGLVFPVFATVFLIYYLISLPQTFMGTKFSTTSIGLYVAILSSLILCFGVVLKSKESD